ncbi:hypothetical protein PM01_03555 [Sulfitobacter pontiacus 3SOLIMAR09]|jgi:hypothetical protein|nr:hypothetical protein PM01_03555 [Sulfitobacter pontiacus 3SOLIMAR09]
MIGLLAHRFMRSAWGRYLMLGLAILAGLKGWGELREREGRVDAKERQSLENIKTMRRMQDAGAAVATDRRSVVTRLRKGNF